MKVEKYLRHYLRCLLLVISVSASSTVFGFAQDGPFSNAREDKSRDSLAIVNAIQLSRDIHRSNHEPDTEYQEAEKAISLSIALGDTLLYAKAQIGRAHV